MAMADVRLKILLNKGREGIPMHKFAEFAKEIDSFLRMLCTDLQIEKAEWVVEKFKNGSVELIPRLSVTTEEQQAQGMIALERITNPKTTVETLPKYVRRETFGQYARVIKPGDTDEVVQVSVYTEKGTISRRILNKKRAVVIEKQVRQRINKYCGFKGTISAFYPGSRKFHLTEKGAAKTVNCIFFKDDMYARVIKVLQKQNVLLNVEGWLRQELTDDSAYLYVEHLSELPVYQKGDLEKFFGCDPDFTGDLSTEEYLDKMRERELDSPLIS